MSYGRFMSLCPRTLLPILLGLLVFCAPAFSTIRADEVPSDEVTPSASEEKSSTEKELAFSIEGLWYVLVHYTDDHAMDPEGWHWEDHLWAIKIEDEKMRWRDYAIVIFDDTTGRFERVGRNPLSKVTGAWEPSPEQRENIRLGLRANERGSQSKRLKSVPQGESASQGKGESQILWESKGAAPPTSASMVTFSSIWRVERQDGMPIFSWNDLLDSGRAESMEGRTEFRCERIDENGVVHGRFDRDGVRHGRFRLYRSGELVPLKKKKKKWSDMYRDHGG
ncbi:MAG: hypothetical protein JRC77_05830 [Deltaproteobacteria bacterium]|nr:hypothetical protein [Deltaproteobacteria bacterium]